MLQALVENIIAMQQNRVTILTGQQYYPVDIRLTNGNILLRAFRIMALENGVIKGVTWREEYSAPRENREVVFSYFKLEELAWLNCSELGIEYEKEISRL